MVTTKLLVWTRYRAELDAVRRVVSDPAILAACLPAPLRWEVDHPAAWTAAWRVPVKGAVLHGRVHTPLGTVQWDQHVVDGLPGLRLTTRTLNAWADVLHRRRLERAIGGRVRLVEEVLLTPRAAWGPLLRQATSATLKATHRHLAALLPADPDHLALHRAWTLEEANLGHAEALFSGIDHPGEPPA